MNLVIDDAVEVTLAKKESPEERRKLGESITPYVHTLYQQLSRPSAPQGRQHFSHPASPVSLVDDRRVGQEASGATLFAGLFFL